MCRVFMVLALGFLQVVFASVSAYDFGYWEDEVVRDAKYLQRLSAVYEALKMAIAAEEFPHSKLVSPEGDIRFASTYRSINLSDSELKNWPINEVRTLEHSSPFRQYIGKYWIFHPTEIDNWIANHSYPLLKQFSGSCTGTLVGHSRVALTTAHCMEKYRWSRQKYQFLPFRKDLLSYVHIFIPAFYKNGADVVLPPLDEIEIQRIVVAGLDCRQKLSPDARSVTLYDNNDVAALILRKSNTQGGFLTLRRPATQHRSSSFGERPERPGERPEHSNELPPERSAPVVSIVGYDLLYEDAVLPAIVNATIVSVDVHSGVQYASNCLRNGGSGGPWIWIGDGGKPYVAGLFASFQPLATEAEPTIPKAICFSPLISAIDDKNATISETTVQRILAVAMQRVQEEEAASRFKLRFRSLFR